VRQRHGSAPTIQALLAARLDRLGPTERAVLACASVVGKDFAPDALAALLPREARQPLPRHLQTLVRKGLIQPQRPSQANIPSHSFRHILIQQASYRAVPKATRAQLHEVLGDWMESRGNSGPPWSTEVIGHHLEQAALYRREVQPGAPAARLAHRAAGDLHVAANDALAIGDAAAAVNLFQRADRLLTRGDDTRAAILTGLGAAQVEAGLLEQARATLSTALHVATERGRDDLQAHARIQALLLGLHVDPTLTLSEIPRALPGLRDTFTRHGDKLGMCRAWQLQAAASWAKARSADAEAAWEHAASYARAVGDQRHLTRSLRWLASAALWGPTPARQGIALCDGYLEEIGNTRPAARSFSSTWPDCMR